MVGVDTLQEKDLEDNRMKFVEVADMVVEGKLKMVVEGKLKMVVVGTVVDNKMTEVEGDMLKVDVLMNYEDSNNRETGEDKQWMVVEGMEVLMLAEAPSIEDTGVKGVLLQMVVPTDHSLCLVYWHSDSVL